MHEQTTYKKSLPISSKTTMSLVLKTCKYSTMLKNRKLAKAISEVVLVTISTMLEYKAKWYGKQVIVVSKTFASPVSYVRVVDTKIKTLKI